MIIKIFSKKWNYNVALSLKKMLTHYNINSIIVFNITREDIECNKRNTNEYYILLGDTEELPIRYFYYNLESISSIQNNGHKKCKNLIDIVNNSILTFDFAQNNLAKKTSYFTKLIVYMPVPINSIDNTEQSKKYDLLFIGNINERRQKILSFIEDETPYKIKIINNIYDEKLYKYIKKTKYLINIHQHIDNFLETSRIHEVVRFNIPMISELPGQWNDENLNGYYNKFITFGKNFENKEELLTLLDNTFKKMPISHDKKNSLTEDILKFIKITNSKAVECLNCVHYVHLPNLFHKYLLNVSNPSSNISYNIRNNIKLSSKNIAHLHCQNLSDFEYIYGNIVTKLNSYSVIVTYVQGNINQKYTTKYLFLNVPNKGLDIGGKFATVAYLNENKFHYTHILFLNPKHNNKQKIHNFPFESQIEYITSISKNFDGLFPEGIMNGDTNKGKHQINYLYFNDITKFLNIEVKHHKYLDGNCILLSKKVIDLIFSNKAKIIYNLLNTSNSFDLNWFSFYYNKSGDYKKLFNMFVTNKLLPNGINSNMYEGCIESVFEKLYLTAIEHLNGKYKLIPCDWSSDKNSEEKNIEDEKNKKTQNTISEQTSKMQKDKIFANKKEVINKSNNKPSSNSVSDNSDTVKMVINIPNDQINNKEFHSKFMEALKSVGLSNVKMPMER